jgi:hypothetical protein
LSKPSLDQWLKPLLALASCTSGKGCLFCEVL